MSIKYRLLSKLLVLATALAIFARPTPAWACSCMMPPPPAQEFADRQAVFVGTVTGGSSNLSIPFVTQIQNWWNQWTGSTQPVGPATSDMPKVEFSVQDSWKGVTTSTVAIAASSDSASCGIEFVPGQQYLVYAYDFDGAGLQTNMCTRTTDITNASADLTYLNTQPKLTLTSADSPFWPIAIAGVVLLIGAAAAGVYFVRRKPAAKNELL